MLRSKTSWGEIFDRCFIQQPQRKGTVDFSNPRFFKSPRDNSNKSRFSIQSNIVILEQPDFSNHAFLINFRFSGGSKNPLC